MTSDGVLWTAGTAALREDAHFGPWVGRSGAIEYTLSEEHPFDYLVRAIVYQQLATAAAATIHGRVCEALGGEVVPAKVLATDPETLRAAGMSRAKLKSVRDLAARVDDGSLGLELAELNALDDAAVVERLSAVWGIGRWTAEMFLMFRLGRPDVWPVGDLGVRSGWARIHGLDERPDARALEAAADHLRPHRSAVAWYCWRALEIPSEDE